VRRVRRISLGVMVLAIGLPGAAPLAEAAATQGAPALAEQNAPHACKKKFRRYRDRPGRGRCKGRHSKPPAPPVPPPAPLPPPCLPCAEGPCPLDGAALVCPPPCPPPCPPGRVCPLSLSYPCIEPAEKARLI
jgi:hypothetical protein